LQRDDQHNGGERPHQHYHRLRGLPLAAGPHLWLWQTMPCGGGGTSTTVANDPTSTITAFAACRSLPVHILGCGRLCPAAVAGGRPHTRGGAAVPQRTRSQPAGSRMPQRDRAVSALAAPSPARPRGDASQTPDARAALTTGAPVPRLGQTSFSRAAAQAPQRPANITICDAGQEVGGSRIGCRKLGRGKRAAPRRQASHRRGGSRARRPELAHEMLAPPSVAAATGPALVSICRPS
jgi:hypothetical protein